MQTKINSFFKPQNPSSNNQSNSQQLFHLQNSVAHEAQRSSDTEEEKIACGNGMESTSEISYVQSENFPFFFFSLFRVKYICSYLFFFYDCFIGFF